MDELWRKTSELLWARPLLWLPVLVADLLAFSASIGSNALVHTVVWNKLQYHSALGGGPIRGQLDPAAVQHASLLAGLVTLPFDFLRLLLYAIAFIVTAALVLSFARRDEKPTHMILPVLRRHLTAVFALSLRALAIYGGMALVAGWVSQTLLAHGHKTWLATGWFQFGIGAVRVALLAFLLAPVAVGVVGGRLPTGVLRTAAQSFAFALGLVSLVLGIFVSANVRVVHFASTFTRYLLELTGSWIVALPFAVFFVAATFVGLRVSGEMESSRNLERSL